MQPRQLPQAPVMISCPDPAEVEKKYRNNVLMQITYRVAEGTQNKEDIAHHINLKVFPCEVVSKKRMAYQKMRLSYAFYYMPARFYDVNKPDSFCLREFLDTNPDQTWYENLPLTDIVCTRYIAQKSVGCKHFVRGCELQCPVCHKFCMCQFCHEDLDHDMDPSQVMTMRCVYCKEVQPK